MIRLQVCATTLIALTTATLALHAGEPAEAWSPRLFLAPNTESVPTERRAATQAAAQRALHLCTGLFTAGLDEARLALDMPLPARATGLQTEIDRTARTVSVHYLADMPPRVAVWRPHVGCTQLPVGASVADARLLLRPVEAAQAPDFDGRDWPQGDRGAVAEPPRSQRQGLESIAAAAVDAGSYGGSTWGVLVLQNGRIRAERYAQGYGPHTPIRTNAMCKTLAATLVGVGVRKRLVDLEKRPALREWTQPGDPRGAITLHNLLQMDSGLYTESGGNPQNALYYGGATGAERAALNVLDSRPGTRFLYAGADTILAVRALRQAHADDATWPLFPQRELLWKIGMTRTTLAMDWQGDFIMSGDCWSTARDFARLGQLYLDDGVWNGERLLPEGWAKYVATAAPSHPRSGAHFWLFGGYGGLPEDAYGAYGAQGQYAVIIPSKKLVVIRRGLDGQGGSFDMPRFTTEMIAALRL